MAAAKPVRNRACTNSECEMFGKMDQGNIRLHGFSPLKRGKRRRYRCTRCGTTFSSTTNTAYYRLKSSRDKVDMACQLSVEGMNISAISRALHKSWNTIERWLERAREFCKQFLDLHLLLDYHLPISVISNSTCAWVSQPSSPAGEVSTDIRTACQV